MLDKSLWSKASSSSCKIFHESYLIVLLSQQTTIYHKPGELYKISTVRIQLTHTSFINLGNWTKYNTERTQRTHRTCTTGTVTDSIKWRVLYLYYIYCDVISSTLLYFVPSLLHPSNNYLLDLGSEDTVSFNLLELRSPQKVATWTQLFWWRSNDFEYMHVL